MSSLTQTEERLLWFGEPIQYLSGEYVEETIKKYQFLSPSEDVLFMMIENQYGISLNDYSFFWCECGGTFWIDVEVYW